MKPDETVLGRGLETLTWRQAGAALAQRPAVLLPVGTLEQNGEFAPMGGDTFIAVYFAREVSRRARVLLLPAIPYGYSAAFMGFPGTVTLEPDTLRLAVRDVVASVAMHGATHVVVVNNHGPSEPMVEHALREVRRRFSLRTTIVWPSKLLRLIAERRYPERMARAGHGGEPTASVMAAIVPETLRVEGVKGDRPGALGEIRAATSQIAWYQDLPVNLCLDWDEVSATGTTGDPSQADAQWGQALLDELVAWGHRFVEHFMTVPVPGATTRAGPREQIGDSE